MIASSHQWTPLHMAAYNSNLDTVQHLIVTGADLNIRTDKGVSVDYYIKD